MACPSAWDWKKFQRQNKKLMSQKISYHLGCQDAEALVSQLHLGATLEEEV